MAKFKILVTGHTNPEWLSDLNEIGELVLWEGEESFLMPREKLLPMIKDFDAVINFAEVVTNEEFVFEAKKLKIIANVSIGFDNLNLPLLSIFEIWATNAPGFFNYPVAEYVMAGILAIKRRLLEADDFIRRGEWKSFEPGRWDGTSLKFRTLGIIGMGSVGKELKKMAESIGMTVIYFDPNHQEEAGSLPLEDLIGVSDIVSVHVPLNDSTYHFFNTDIIFRMKKGAVLVNTSRGKIIDEDALIYALETGHLSGAVLDVFSEEPNVSEKLKRMKNVLLTPHMAGGTVFAREGCVRCAAANVVDVLTGNVPRNALNNPNAI
jgi:glyoxylate reductase